MFKNKKVYALALILAAGIFLVGCTPSQPAATATPEVTDVPATEVPVTDAPEETAGAQDALSLTLEELKAFDGKEGRRAYIAVDGIIYDVTDSAAWANGTHNGHNAGQDLTEALKGAPHGPEKLDNVVEIGVLAD